jgi:signal transduction histidine kinase
VERERASAVCRVIDEGPGISAADRAKLFQRGAHLKAKPTNGEGSHGFGLAVAAELIAHLGGEIGCESSSGKGACFYFRLPCPRSGRSGGRTTKRPKLGR